MAQTKRKRRRKHRGTQAGTIEAPGRTGRSRAPASSGRSPSRPSAGRSGSGRAQRPNRYDKPPTWKGSAQRAGIMAAVIVIALGILQKNWAGAVVLGVVALALYVPATYYMDRAMYRRRQRQKQGPPR